MAKTAIRDDKVEVTTRTARANSQLPARRSDLVVQSNELVQASYSLPLTEKRLIALAIVTARETGRGISANSALTITAKSYAQQFNVSLSAAYKALHDAAEQLFERQVTIYGVDPETGKSEKIKTRWVSQISYVESVARLKVIFAPVVVNHISQLTENFTKYELQQISALTSVHAFRLYEMLIQWREVCKTPPLEISLLRDQLGLGDNDYPRIFDFKKWVIDTAIEQINRITDIEVQYEQHKRGRSISALSFTFQFKSGFDDMASTEIIDATAVRISPVNVPVALAGMERQLLKKLKELDPQVTEQQILQQCSQQQREPFDVLSEQIELKTAQPALFTHQTE